MSSSFDLGQRQRLLDEAERAPILHLPRGPQERAQGGPAKRRSQADALHAERGQRRGGQQRALDLLEAHHHVDRLVDGGADRADVLGAGQARGEQHVDAGAGERLQPPDGSVQIAHAEAKVLGPADQDERKRQGARRLDGGGHALDRVLKS